MADPLEALRQLIRALELHYGPADSLYEAYFGEEKIKKALDEAYECLNNDPREG